MSLERNKANMRRWYEEIGNKGNLDLIDELSAKDSIDHTRPPGIPQGNEGTKQLMTMMHNAFPDMRTTVEDMIAEGDKVVSRVTSTGTHKGEFMGIPPTGKKFTITAVHIIRVAPDGKSVEHWGIMDQMSMMQQLGLVPAPGQPA